MEQRTLQARTAVARKVEWYPQTIPSRISESEPKVPEPSSHRGTRLLILPVLILLGAIYVARIGPPVTYPLWGFDSSISVVSALSLSEGHGPRLINHPQSPVSPYIPVGYPTLLAVALRFVSLDPAGVTFLRGISLISCLIFIFLSYRLLLRYISPAAAAGVMLLVGLQPWVVVWAGELFTECPFAMWVAAALLLAKRGLDEKSDEARRWWLNAALAGVFIGFAMMTRVIGFTLIIGIGTAFALNRKWRQLFVFTASTILTQAPWQLWSMLSTRGAGTASNYLSWTMGQYHWSTPFYDLWRLVVRVVPAIYFAPVGTPDGRLILDRIHLLPVFSVLGVLFSLAFLAGLVMLLKRRDLVALCLLFYLGLVILYPAEPTRYIMPLYALLAIPLITGLKPLWQRKRFRIPSPVLSITFGILVTVMVIGSVITNSIRVANVYASGHFYGARGMKDWTDLTKAFEWINHNVPQDGLVVTLYSCSVYLFTDKLTISPYHDLPGSKTPPASAERLEEVLASVNTQTPTFVFARPFPMENEELSVAAVKGFISKYPDRLNLRWETPDHKLMIYEVVQPAPGADTASGDPAALRAANNVDVPYTSQKQQIRTHTPSIVPANVVRQHRNLCPEEH